MQRKPEVSWGMTQIRHTFLKGELMDLSLKSVDAYAKDYDLSRIAGALERIADALEGKDPPDPDRMNLFVWLAQRVSQE